MPKNKVLSHGMVGLLGMFMPVCECGNVPVTRRLLAKNFSVSQAVTFMLAAPIVNPITLITTLEAFSVDPTVAYLRIGAGFGIALAIGLIFSTKKNQEEFLVAGFKEKIACDDHSVLPKWQQGLDIFQREFVEIFKMLFLGAFIAALSQAFIPREVVASVGVHSAWSIVAMLVLAFVVSICSNVDAFFALSYAQTFTLGSLMTFLLFGPMIDIKILMMLRSTFKVRFLIILTMLVALFAIAAGLSVNVFYRRFL